MRAVAPIFTTRSLKKFLTVMIVSLVIKSHPEDLFYAGIDMRASKLMPLLCRLRLAADMAPVAFLHRRQSLSRTASRSNWRSAQFYWPTIA